MPKTSQENLDKEATDAAERLGKSPGALELPTTKPMSAEDVLALGEEILIGSKIYLLARPRMVDEGKVSQYLGQIPLPFVMHAVAAVRNGGNLDNDATTELLSEINGSKQKLTAEALVRRVVDAINVQRASNSEDLVPYPDGVEVNTDDFTSGITSLGLGITFLTEARFDESSAEAAVDTVYLLLKRRQPDLTRDEIADELDVMSFMRFLVRLYAMNDMLLASF